MKNWKIEYKPIEGIIEEECWFSVATWQVYRTVYKLVGIKYWKSYDWVPFEKAIYDVIEDTSTQKQYKIYINWKQYWNYLDHWIPDDKLLSLTWEDLKLPLKEFVKKYFVWSDIRNVIEHSPKDFWEIFIEIVLLIILLIMLIKIFSFYIL